MLLAGKATSGVVGSNRKTRNGKCAWRTHCFFRWTKGFADEDVFGHSEGKQVFDLRRRQPAVLFEWQSEIEQQVDVLIKSSGSISPVHL